MYKIVNWIIYCAIRVGSSAANRVRIVEIEIGIPKWKWVKNKQGVVQERMTHWRARNPFFFLFPQNSIFVFLCFDVIKSKEKKGEKKVENNETKWQVQSVINRNDFLAHFYDITPQSRAKCGTVLNVWWSKSCWGIKSRRVGGKMIFLYFIFMYKLW